MTTTDADAIAEGFAAAPWLREAAALRDGATDDDGRAVVRIMQAADRATVLALPWCGVFVAHCIRRTRPDLDVPAVRCRARPWLSHGAETTPRLGAVLVFWMVARWSPFGHVGFYWGEDDEDFHVIGGNQHDRMTVQRWPKDRLLAARWPDPLATPPLLRPRRSPAQAEAEEVGALA